MPLRQRNRTVRPRLVWGGLVVALAGAIVLSAGIMIDSIITSILGAVVLCLGAAASIRGGVLLDAHSHLRPQEELRHVLTGEELPATAPGQMHDEPYIRAAAQETAARTTRLQRRTAGNPQRSILASTGGLMVLVAIALIFTPWHLLNYSIDRTHSWIHTAAAVLLTLSGIPCLLGTGTHRIAGGTALLAGSGLLLDALIASHTHNPAGAEIVLGAIAMAAGGAALLARRSGKSSESSGRGHS